MSSSAPDPGHETHRRLTTLEELFTHLQQTVEALDQVIQEQQRALGQIELALARVNGHVERLRASEPDHRDPQAEKPPHY